jgi:hypothetical protein
MKKQTIHTSETKEGPKLTHLATDLCGLTYLDIPKEVAQSFENMFGTGLDKIISMMLKHQNDFIVKHKQYDEMFEK